MKNLSLLFAVVLSILLTSCASTVAVYTDEDPQIDLSQYATYNWKFSSKGYQPSASTIAVIQTTVDTSLAGKGYKLTNHPAFLVVYHVVRQYHEGVTQIVTTNPGPYPYWYNDYGYNYNYGFWPAYTQTVTQTTPYQEGTLLIDFIDAKTHQAIFRGSASAVVQDQYTNQQNLADGIRKMLANLPSRPIN